MTVNKKQKCEGSGTGGGLQEETAQQANATFEFYVSSKSKSLAYHSIHGSILVGGEKVGSIEGRLVNRRHVRMNGPRCKISFRSVCAKVRIRSHHHDWVHYPYSYGATEAMRMQVRGQDTKFSFQVEADARLTGMGVRCRPGSDEHYSVSVARGCVGEGQISCIGSNGNIRSSAGRKSRTPILGWLCLRIQVYPSFDGNMTCCMQLATTQASHKLVEAAALLFDVNGFCDCKRMLESEAWSSDADEGGLVHIDMVRVAKEYRGRELGLQALRHLLTVELKGEWTLAMIRPFLVDYEKKPGDDKICQDFSSMQKSWRPVSEEMKRQKAEVAERHDRAHLAVSRYYARMGFTQANNSFWFLAAGKPMLRSRAECDALPVMTKPSDILSEAEEKLVEMARAAAPIQAADVEALVAQGVRLAAPACSTVPYLHASHFAYSTT